MELKDRLRELRESIVLEDGKKCSQKQFAEIIGVKQNNYNNWENGREPNLQTLIKIADYYGVTLDYLVGHSDYKQPELRGICEETGLSEEAAEGLTFITDDEIGWWVISDLLEEYGFTQKMNQSGGENKYISVLGEIIHFYLNILSEDFDKPFEFDEPTSWVDNKGKTYFNTLALARKLQFRTKGEEEDQYIETGIMLLLKQQRKYFLEFYSETDQDKTGDDSE